MRLSKYQDEVFVYTYHMGQVLHWLANIDLVRNEYIWSSFFVSNMPDVKRVLDAGCGPGFRSYNLAYLRPNIEVVAVDNYRPSIDAAVRHLSLPNLRFFHRDLLNIDLGHFDLVAFNYVLHHLEEDQVKSVLNSLDTDCVYIGDYNSSFNNTDNNPKLAAWRQERIRMGDRYPELFRSQSLKLPGYGQVETFEALTMDSQLAAHEHWLFRQALYDLGYGNQMFSLRSTQEGLLDSFEIIASN